MVSVAAPLVALPKPFVATQRKRAPLSDGATFATFNAAVVTSAKVALGRMFDHDVPPLVDICHCSEGEGFPAAVTSNVVLPPAGTLRSAGEVMMGGPGAPICTGCSVSRSTAPTAIGGRTMSAVPPMIWPVRTSRSDGAASAASPVAGIDSMRAATYCAPANSGNARMLARTSRDDSVPG
jgi:hypothetical protein